MSNIIQNKYRSIVNVVQPPVKSMNFDIVKDAMLVQAKPLLNYGYSIFMQSSSDGTHDNGYCSVYGTGNIHNELAKHADELVSVSLVLQIAGYNPDAHSLDVYGYSNDWNEGIITWNNAPVKGTKITSVSTKPNQVTLSIDVTGYVVQNILKNTDPTTNKEVSFYIIGNKAEKNPISFYSKESYMKPKLVFKYYDASQTAYQRFINGEVTVNARYTNIINGQVTVDTTQLNKYIDGTVIVDVDSAFTNTYTDASGEHKETTFLGIKQYNQDKAVTKSTSTGDIDGTFILEQEATIPTIDVKVKVWSASAFTDTYYKNTDLIYTGTDPDEIKKYNADKTITKTSSTGDITGTMKVIGEVEKYINGSARIHGYVSGEIDGTVTVAGAVFTTTVKDNKTQKSVYSGKDPNEVEKYVKQDTTISTNADIDGKIFIQSICDKEFDGKVTVVYNSAFAYTFNKDKTVLYNGDDTVEIGKYLKDKTVTSISSTGDIDGTINIKALFVTDIDGEITVANGVHEDINGTVVVASPKTIEIDGKVIVEGGVTKYITGWVRNPPQDAFITTITSNDNKQLYKGRDVDEENIIIKTKSKDIKDVSSTGDIVGELDVHITIVNTINGKVTPCTGDVIKDINGTIKVKMGVSKVIDGKIAVKYAAPDKEINGTVVVMKKMAVWLNGSVTVAFYKYNDLDGEINVRACEIHEIKGTVEVSGQGGSYAFIM